MKFCDEKIQQHLLNGGKIKTTGIQKALFLDEESHRLSYKSVHGINEQYVLSKPDLLADDRGNELNPKRFIIEQCSGSKDSKGNLIYKGDILKIPNDWETYGFLAGTIVKVIFNNGGFRLASLFNKNSKGFWLEDTETHEVIGNVHENKQLLEI